MAGFDFVEYAAKAYRFVWNNRSALMRVSAAAVLFKIISFMGITALHIDDNLLRQGLLLLPSHAWEGVVLARVIVLAVALEVQRPVSGSMVVVKVTSSLQGAVLFYVLIKLALSFVVGIAFMGGGGSSLQDPAAAEQSPQILLLGLFLTGLMFWAYRFLWVYVPVALGYSALEYAARFKSFISVLPMMGLWTLCFTPIALLMILASEIMGTLIPLTPDAPPPVLYAQSMAVIQAVSDYMISLLSSIAMAYGVHAAMDTRTNKERL